MDGLEGLGRRGRIAEGYGTSRVSRIRMPRRWLHPRSRCRDPHRSGSEAAQTILAARLWAFPAALFASGITRPGLVGVDFRNWAPQPIRRGKSSTAFKQEGN